MSQCFELVHDPDKLRALNAEGLLWWVGPEDGGWHGGISTILVPARMRGYNWENGEGYFGVLLED